MLNDASEMLSCAWRSNNLESDEERENIGMQHLLERIDWKQNNVDERTWIRGDLKVA